MSEGPSQNTASGCLGTLVIGSCIIVGAALGGLFGHEELGPLGAILGALSGGFVGFLVGMLLNVAIALSLIAVVFLGPIALLLLVLFWLVDTYG
jgi:hypothetical protein